MKLLLPKSFVDIGRDPAFFLLGPIKGGDDWQEGACMGIDELSDLNVTIANPCHYDASHPLFAYRALSAGPGFDRQLTWERHYLEHASRHGCILAWLPCESETDPRTDGQPYARDSYGEIAEWRGRMMFDPTIRIVVGAEAGFPGLDVMQRNFSLALKRDFKIHATLDETVAAAVKTVKDGPQW